MKFWFQRAEKVWLQELDGCHVGQVVRHKISGVRMVIVCLYVTKRGKHWAIVSTGIYSDCEFGCHVAE